MRRGGGKQIFQLCLTRNHKRGDALRMLGVGNAFEQAIHGLENREGHFRACNERCEFFAVAFAGFAEEDGFELAPGFEGFLDQAESLDTDAAGIGLQAAAERDTKLLQPAIVAAGKKAIGRGSGAIVTAGFRG